ncbi:hypothetical protein [Streptomyces sp. HUAS TT20]|uniref:hypothetical protein n=1 Tax=Streptomyces sp. HUAS TT20 TaxID=3447509 RepID=UPI0021DA456F|nr:hypothetical protein [Streptomyces sp. HUAS 15-9]UXY29192.1 hypothetical protein N8I87_23300 [Streptomyces sp. HUAS 15-9]
MSKVRIATALPCLLLLAACGTSGSPTADPSPSPTTRYTPPPADKGPECEGDKAAKGLHVLRAASASLPGGTKVQYADAKADGKHRSAELAVGNARQTVRPAQKVTLGGHTYTVSQICTYRVVLTAPGLPASTHKGKHMPVWPTTYEGHWRLRWHVPDNGPQGMGAVVTDIESDPPSATISAADSGSHAFYNNLRPGATVEIAGKLWKVETIDGGHMNVDMSSPDFKAGYVDLRQLGDA